MKKLSKNEQQVLNLMAQGLKNREIAQLMKSKKGKTLSEKTISTYALRIRDKIGVPADKNTHFLIIVATYKGLVKQKKFIDLVEDLEVDGVDPKDYPDFCDSFFSKGFLGDREMTDYELDELSEKFPETLSEMAYQSLMS
jgi:DNA-binding CsgD family transcriptional regulator